MVIVVGWHTRSARRRNRPGRKKNEYGLRAAALAHDVLVKSANRIGDQVRLQDDGYHLVVFNPLSLNRTDLVRVPGIPPDPCSRPLHWRDADHGNTTYRILGASALIGRGQVRIPADLLDGPFELIDTTTQQSIPYQVTILIDPLAAKPLAAHRYALGHIGANSLDALSYDRAHLMELVFVAENVPPMGYIHTVWRLPHKNQYSIPACRWGKPGSKTASIASSWILLPG